MPEIFEWVPDYSSEKICIDGMALAGKKLTLEEYERQYYPGAEFLACGGECDCRLTPTGEETETTEGEPVPPTPTTPAPQGGAGILLVLDGEVRSRVNQAPKAQKPKGDRNPDGTTTNFIKNPRGGANIVENTAIARLAK